VDGLLLPLFSVEAAITFLFMALHGVGLFSNSFIEAENKVVWYLVMSSSFIYLVLTFKTSKKSSWNLGLPGTG
jgi:hypothetical protein